VLSLDDFGLVCVCLCDREPGLDQTLHERGTDRLGRRAKRFLTSLQKYEIWLRLVRGETTIGEAADRFEVDRSTIMRLRTVAKDGALAALADSKAGVAAARRDLELEAARAEAARLGEALKELAVRLLLVCLVPELWRCISASCATAWPSRGLRQGFGLWSSGRCGPVRCCSSADSAPDPSGGRSAWG
jgi:transposase